MHGRAGGIESIPALAIAWEAGRDVRRAVARIGRTEDVVFAPSGRRIAIAGFRNNRLLVLDIAADLSGARPRVALTGCVELGGDALRLPHGIAWADEATLVVASRDRHVAFVPLPDPRPGATRVTAAPSRLIGADGRDLVTAPAALCAVPAGLGLLELLVCNNFVHHVSRHLIDRNAGDAVLAGELLLAEGIEEPHGIVQSPSGRWLAVANHLAHQLLLFRNDDRLGPASRPDGILAGLEYPHGIRFAADERSLLVSEATTPFVQLFRSADGEWSGERSPAGRIRTVGERVFARRNPGLREGGPKGIDLSPDNRLLLATCEAEPFALFDLRAVLAEPARQPLPTAADEAARARATMVRYLARARDAARHESEAIRRAFRYEREELIVRQETIETMKASRSWRLTHPLRWLNARLRRARRRLRG